jgi:hypothetical protein
LAKGFQTTDELKSDDFSFDGADWKLQSAVAK